MEVDKIDRPSLLLKYSWWADEDLEEEERAAMKTGMESVQESISGGAKTAMTLFLSLENSVTTEAGFIIFFM